ncbi:MAG: hypothetical protein ACRC62_13765, partial [Microcoleus sp.]
MIAIPNNVEKFPTAYGYPDVSKQFNRLWDLVWANGGENISFPVGDRQAEAFVEWWCNGNKFSIYRIVGETINKYSINVGASFVQLILEGRYYMFYSKPNYGSFSVLNSVFLVSGSACYFDRWEDEPVDQFINFPLISFQGRVREKWLMTNEAASEVT